MFAINFRGVHSLWNTLYVPFFALEDKIMILHSKKIDFKIKLEESFENVVAKRILGCNRLVIKQTLAYFFI